MTMNSVVILLLLYTVNLSLVDAFTPLKQHSSKSWSLQAETLEGWKINGAVKPLNNFILIKLDAFQEKSESGILFSKTAKIKKTQGTVISVGPGSPHKDSGILYPMPVKPGDGVVYGKYDGTEILIDGDRHSLIRDSDILIKFTGDKLTIDSVEAVNESVLVAVETRETSTSGGLLLTSGKNDESKRPSTGKVVKVGPGRMSIDGALLHMTVDVGDVVKFRDYAGNEVKIGDDEFTVVKMTEIMAKF